MALHSDRISSPPAAGEENLHGLTQITQAELVPANSQKL
jgi:hypothetical protein